MKVLVGLMTNLISESLRFAAEPPACSYVGIRGNMLHERRGYKYRMSQTRCHVTRWGCLASYTEYTLRAGKRCDYVGRPANAERDTRAVCEGSDMRDLNGPWLP